MMKQLLNMVIGNSNNGFYASVPRWKTIYDENDVPFKGYDFVDVANYLSKEKFEKYVREGFELFESNDILVEETEISREEINKIRVSVIRENNPNLSATSIGSWTATVYSEKEYKFKGTFMVSFRNIGGRCRCYVVMSYYDSDLDIDIKASSAYEMYSALKEAVEGIENKKKALQTLEIKKQTVARPPKKK